MKNEGSPQETLLAAETARLKALLERHNVPLERWGQGETTRTLEQLAKEVLEGEATVTEDPNGGILRTGLGVAIHVYFRDESGQRLVLKEDRQEYADGRIRRRGDKIGMSIGEKQKRGEPPEQAAVRAFAEELKIRMAEDRLGAATPETKRTPSEAFPGITTLYVRMVYRVTLRPDEFRPEGYIERQEDKTTYFVWEPVPEPSQAMSTAQKGR